MKKDIINNWLVTFPKNKDKENLYHLIKTLEFTNKVDDIEDDDIINYINKYPNEPWPWNYFIYHFVCIYL